MLDTLKLDDDDYKLLITPNTEKLCLQFINSIPTQQQQSHADDDSMHTPVNLSAFLTPQLITLNPFSIELAASSTAQSLITHQDRVEPPPQLDQHFSTPQGLLTNVTLDHDYTSDRKRKISYAHDDSTLDSTFAESMTSSSSRATTDTNTNKKKRTKGVYRKQDVTNETELQSYLERRKKNNVSSKQSRLAKKNLNQSMDERADQIERDNERLKLAIEKLEGLTKLMKDVLLERLTLPK